jgi:hypothetical protein
MVSFVIAGFSPFESANGPLSVYFFRWIIHNYSTPFAVKILKNLIPALKPGARIVINDHCLRKAGQEDPWDETVMRRMDMVMWTLLNAQERTEAEFRDLFKAASDGFVFKVSGLYCFLPVISADGSLLLGCHKTEELPHEHYRGGVAAQGGVHGRAQGGIHRGGQGRIQGCA